MRYLIKCVAIFLLVIACITFQPKSVASLPLCQIQSGKFRGIVVDENGKRIRGANVTVAGSGMKRQLKSNRVGEFTLELPVGVYEITVEQAGVTNRLINLEVKAGANLSQTFQLQPSHSLQTYSQSTHLNGKVKGNIVNLVCKPLPSTRVTFKNRRWEQIITPDQNGHFIVEAPAGDYLISVSSAKPQAFIIGRGKNGELYLFVDTGIYCDHCSCGESYEDDWNKAYTVEPIIIDTGILERKPIPVP